jgi:hypothetical protein
MRSEQQHEVALGIPCAEAFCINGIIVVAPKTSIDVTTATTMIPLIVWPIFFSQ